MVKAIESHNLWAEFQLFADQPTGTGVALPFVDRTVGVRHRQIKQRQVAGTKSADNQVSCADIETTSSLRI